MVKRQRQKLWVMTAVTVVVSCIISIAAKQPVSDESAGEQVYTAMMANAVDGFSEMADLYAWEWLDFLPLSLPYEDSFLQTMPMPVPLILPNQTKLWGSAYSEGFIDGLIPVVKEGITFFPIQLILNSANRELGIYNVKEQLIATIPLDDEFLPVEWAEKCFGTGSALTADRMQLCLDLILEGDIPLYITLQELKAEAKPEEPEFPIIMMRYDGPPVTNIQFTAIEKKTNGVMVTIAYPNDYTNRLELFQCDDLVAFWWTSYGVSNVNSSTNWIEWTDTGATNGGGSLCFYAAGNADLDSDSDGLTDAREKYMYHSSPTNSNTDGDAFSDYEEVITYNTDPSNSDTNKPTILSFFPSNNYHQVWMP